METILLLTAIICILCIFSSNLSYRIGVPSLVLFILLGMLFGTDGILGISFSDYHLTQQICSVALLFIMFYGGFGTNWSMAKPVAGKAILLSTLGVFLTAVLTGLFCFIILNTSLLEGMLIGSVLASTDAASVFSILRGKKLNLTGGLASLLELESGSNDPMAYMMTSILLILMSGSSASVWSILGAQVVFGIATGVLFGICSILFLKKMHFYSRELMPVFVASAALFTYSLSALLGGNGFLSVYIAGILLGNSSIPYKAELVRFFDGITAIMQIVLFFLLGLLCFPSRLVSLFIPATIIAVFMLFVARPLTVYGLLRPFQVPRNQRFLISWSGLRGAASIVFAIYTVISPAVIHTDIFHIVFCVCLMSAAIQGSLLPLVAKKLGVISPTENILKTFNDYQEEQTIFLTDIRLSDHHPWIHKKFSEIILPEGMMAVLVKRKGENLLPKGNTEILPGDTIVFNSPLYSDNTDIPLKEIKIDSKHPWNNKTLSHIPFPKDSLVIFIKRDFRTLIPDGNTKIKKDDIVVLCINS